MNYRVDGCSAAHPVTRFTRVSQQRCFFYDKKDQQKRLKNIKNAAPPEGFLQILETHIQFFRFGRQLFCRHTPF